MSRLSFRPRPLDIHKKLPIVKSVKDFEDDDVPTTANAATTASSTRNSHLLRLSTDSAEPEVFFLWFLRWGILSNSWCALWIFLETQVSFEVFLWWGFGFMTREGMGSSGFWVKSVNCGCGVWVLCLYGGFGEVFDVILLCFCVCICSVTHPHTEFWTIDEFLKLSILYDLKVSGMTLYVFCYYTSSSLSCSINARSFFFSVGNGGGMLVRRGFRWREMTEEQLTGIVYSDVLLIIFANMGWWPSLSRPGNRFSAQLQLSGGATFSLLTQNRAMINVELLLEIGVWEMQRWTSYEVDLWKCIRRVGSLYLGFCLSNIGDYFVVVFGILCDVRRPIYNMLSNFPTNKEALTPICLLGHVFAMGTQVFLGIYIIGVWHGWLVLGGFFVAFYKRGREGWVRVMIIWKDEVLSNFSIWI